jgi:hypothetical protein
MLDGTEKEKARPDQQNDHSAKDIGAHPVTGNRNRWFFANLAVQDGTELVPGGTLLIWFKLVGGFPA